MVEPRARAWNLVVFLSSDCPFGSPSGTTCTSITGRETEIALGVSRQGPSCISLGHAPRTPAGLNGLPCIRVASVHEPYRPAMGDATVDWIATACALLYLGVGA